jgi:HAD superfamily hydrolase (TIGR01459 family)
MTQTKIIAGVHEIVDRFDGVIMDLWGCMHDGIRAYPAALDCLARLKAAGKKVAIVSNAPRRAYEVAARMGELGIGPELYDALLCSGEETWQYLKARPDDDAKRLGKRVYVIMAERDAAFLDGLDLDITTDINTAAFMLVCGIDGPGEQVSDFDAVLKRACWDELPLLCANPDLMVHRGDVAEICAGAIALHYEELGGKVIYHGKPHQGIYRHAMQALGLRDPKRLIGIGDSFRTDVAGAAGFGAQSLLIAGGIHREEVMQSGKLDSAYLAKAAAEFPAMPDFALQYLAW